MCPPCTSEAYCDHTTGFTCQCKDLSAPNGQQCPGNDYAILTTMLGLIFCFISECPVGTYTPRNSPCELCPPNSEAVEPGMSECSCIVGYYRAPFEGSHEPCTCEFVHLILFIKQDLIKYIVYAQT